MGWVGRGAFGDLPCAPGEKTPFARCDDAVGACLAPLLSVMCAAVSPAKVHALGLVNRLTPAYLSNVMAQSSVHWLLGTCLSLISRAAALSWDLTALTVPETAWGWAAAEHLAGEAPLRLRSWAFS